MADLHEEYRMMAFAIVFSLLLATVFGLIGMSDHVPTTEDPSTNVFQGFGDFFRNEDFTGWEKFFYSVTILSPMLSVGTMMLLNYGRGR